MSALLSLTENLDRIDSQMATLEAERAVAFDQIVEDLEWMDIEVLRIPFLWLDGSDLQTSPKLHLLSCLSEEDGSVHTRGHSAARCGSANQTSRWCDQPVGGARRTRHRKGWGYEFTFLGVFDVVARDSDAVACIPEGALLRRSGATT